MLEKIHMYKEEEYNEPKKFQKVREKEHNMKQKLNINKTKCK